MTIAINQQALIFAPIVIANVITTLKDKTIDIKDKMG